VTILGIARRCDVAVNVVARGTRDAVECRMDSPRQGSTTLVREVPAVIINQAAVCRKILWGAAWLFPIGLLVIAIIPVFLDSGINGCHRTEASLQLNKMARNAKIYYAQHGSFPKGHSEMLPPWPCCPEKCSVPIQAWMADPIWAARDFEVDYPHQFRYRYESVDGKTFRATAVGDRDCDGISGRYILDGASEGGRPTMTITEPPPSAGG
jgi:hypothetical protein